MNGILMKGEESLSHQASDRNETKNTQGTLRDQETQSEGPRKNVVARDQRLLKNIIHCDHTLLGLRKDRLSDATAGIFFPQVNGIAKNIQMSKNH